MLLVQSCLTLLETLSLLQSSRDVVLNTGNLSFNASLDCIEVTRHGVLVVTLLLPLRFLDCSFLGLLFRNGSQLFGLNSEISSSIVCLSNILSELENTLALTLIATTRVRQAVAESIDLLLDRGDGSLVILLVPFQAIALLL